MRDSIADSLLIAGVSGSGKSTLAQLWATRFGWRLIDGDRFHAAASVAKMRAAVPLEDSDRIGWLDRVAAAARLSAGAPPPVVSCSALKRAYRDRLREHLPTLHVALLDVPYSVAFERVSTRDEHFMPPVLVASQFATFERPLEEPRTLILDGCRPAAELVARIAEWLGLP